MNMRSMPFSSIVTSRWTIAGVVAFILTAPKFGEGMNWLIRIWNTPEVAYAGQATATEVKSDFDRFISQREEELKLEKQRNELQEDYNQKLLQLQQQQVPNQMYQRQYQAEPSVWREQDSQGDWWCCSSDSYDRCWDEQLWKGCDVR